MTTVGIPQINPVSTGLFVQPVSPAPVATAVPVTTVPGPTVVSTGEIVKVNPIKVEAITPTPKTNISYCGFYVIVVILGILLLVIGLFIFVVLIPGVRIIERVNPIILEIERNYEMVRCFGNLYNLFVMDLCTGLPCFNAPELGACTSTSCTGDSSLLCIIPPPLDN